MPDLDELRDGQGRTFPEYVADQTMAAISTAGMSVRGVATASGLERTGLQDKLNHVRPFNARDLSAIAAALDISPSDLVAGFVPV